MVVSLFVGLCFVCSLVYGGNKRVCDTVCKMASVKNGVRQISYNQFMKIRNSGEKYTLLDVLSADSYQEGHIEGSLSIPFDTINAETAGKALLKDYPVVVYCAGFKCSASTSAAAALTKLGYNALDYKGGLQEWQKKGNKLVK